MSTCQHGHENPDADQYCGTCGAVLDHPLHHEQATSDDDDKAVDPVASPAMEQPGLRAAEDSSERRAYLIPVVVAAVIGAAALIWMNVTGSDPASESAYGTASCVITPKPFDASLGTIKVIVSYTRSNDLEVSFDGPDLSGPLTLEGDSGDWSLVAEDHTPYTMDQDRWSAHLEGNIQGIPAPRDDDMPIGGDPSAVTKDGNVITVRWPDNSKFSDARNTDGDPLTLDDWSASFEGGDQSATCSDPDGKFPSG